ncbi:MAG: hypothetical protein H6835_18865 [Planctomycetes bacterium]|nr:hypothetical protein [Planctomycetota bacterium]
MTHPVENTAPSTGTAGDPVAAILRPLLARQLGRLRRRYLLHGLAKALLLTAALVALFFVLDRWLRLPTPIRLLHTTAVLAVAGFAALRFVRYPLRRHFTEVDLALWVEHTYPELHQRLVSAVQLHSTAQAELRNQSPAMIDALWRDTAAAVGALPLDRLFDDRALHRVIGGAGALSAALLVGALLQPVTARTFLLRHLGLALDYPRATTLIVELPKASADLQVVEHDGETELVLPAGADLHVSVLATGEVPKEVYLVVEPLRDEGAAAGGRELPMTPRPGDRFRHVFRRLAGSFAFHARGGDDDHGDRRVVVRTVRPAQVATLRAVIEPPAYTGVARLEQVGGAIEALLQSRVQLEVQATAPVREGTLVMLESGRRLPLTAVAVQDDSGAATALRCEFVVEGSDRYQVELLADNGLRNPNPGTYPISALQDYAPVGRWLLPGDDTLALLPNALLCLRADTHDDFGLTALQLIIERDGETVRDIDLLPEHGEAQPPRPPRKAALVTELLEMSDLLGAEASATGLFLRLLLRDNKQPEPGAAELPRRIVQVVDAPELAAIVAKGFRRLREEIQQAADIQTDRSHRLADLLAREGVSPGERAQVLTGVEVGQGRIAGAVQRVHRGLMQAFDLHLWNRLEPSQHAATVVQLYREHSAALTEALAVDPAFYRDLIARRNAGTLGAMETTLDPILGMIAIADGLANGAVPAVARTLAEAQVARDDTERAARLAAAYEHQQQIEQALTQLLLRLEEWNDYQDLVQEVRALRDRQRDLQDRTQEARGK